MPCTGGLWRHNAARPTPTSAREGERTVNTPPGGGSIDPGQLGRALGEAAMRRLETLDANALTASDCCRMFELGVRLERLAAGLPTDIVEVRGAPNDVDALVGSVLLQLRRRRR